MNALDRLNLTAIKDMDDREVVYSQPATKTLKFKLTTRDEPKPVKKHKPGQGHPTYSDEYKAYRKTIRLLKELIEIQTTYEARDKIARLIADLNVDEMIDMTSLPQTDVEKAENLLMDLKSLSQR